MGPLVLPRTSRVRDERLSDGIRPVVSKLSRPTSPRQKGSPDRSLETRRPPSSTVSSFLSTVRLRPTSPGTDITPPPSCTSPPGTPERRTRTTIVPLPPVTTSPTDLVRPLTPDGGPEAIVLDPLAHVKSLRLLRQIIPLLVPVVLLLVGTVSRRPFTAHLGPGRLR